MNIEYGQSDKKVPYHALVVEDVFKCLNSGFSGLDNDEVENRRAEYGKNELYQGKRITIPGMFLRQFKDVMIIILLIASLVSGFLGETTDMVIILTVVVLNATIGVIQESKAEKALEALKQMSKPYAKVKRHGETSKIKAEDIVPGDIVLIEAGDYVPADMRLFEASSLKIEEAALTGESVPVEKCTCKIDAGDVVLSDRRNMAYLGSSVTYGNGTGIVTDTGMNTEVGKIAGYITGGEPEKTPLQEKLAEMGKYLSIGVIITAVIIFITGILKGRPSLDMFLTSVSLSVAAIPEGLPAIVTIVLSIGVRKMSRKNAIVRRLPAVEALGSVHIICSDKTGTLTRNKMTVKEVFFDGQTLDANNLAPDSANFPILMEIMALCNNSSITRINETEIKTIGDPTETALVSFTARKGFFKDEMEKSAPRRAEIPFDSERKLMTTINKTGSTYRVLTKGAPDMLLKNCSKILLNGRIEILTKELGEEVMDVNTGMADKALRVLGFAFKDIGTIPEDVVSEAVEKSLIFAGLAGMIDPPREEAKEAVLTCKKAGIRPVMITGDHKNTAAAIAKELNIVEEAGEVITGNELDRMSEDEFTKQVEKYSAYARVSPEHKVRIVKAWKEKGKIVAMTGDGVNDAPALKAADIGIGMGITGTDVAKGVSDIVLSDDNFATIVLSVEEGRKIYSNILKTVQFLLSANIGEIITLFAATMLNWTILFPIHILWINLITDAFPALALGFEGAEKNIMDRKPKSFVNGFFAEGLGISIIYQGFCEALITLFVFFWGISRYSENTAVTMAFATLGLTQLFHSFNMRSKTSIFKIGLFTNKYLVSAFGISALLLVVVIFVPFLSNVFRVAALTAEQWLVVVSMSAAIIPIVEVVKLVHKWKSGRC